MYSIILAVECYIICFNSIDPFIFIFPFINSFLFWLGEGGGGAFFAVAKIGGEVLDMGIFLGGYLFNKFELVKKSPFSFLPP